MDTEVTADVADEKHEHTDTAGAVIEEKQR
jgi:hypothetical protein